MLIQTANIKRELIFLHYYDAHLIGKKTEALRIKWIDQGWPPMKWLEVESEPESAKPCLIFFFF